MNKDIQVYPDHFFTGPVKAVIQIFLEESCTTWAQISRGARNWNTSSSLPLQGEKGSGLSMPLVGPECKGTQAGWETFLPFCV